MLYLLLSIPVAVGLFVIWRLSKPVLTPPEMYNKPRPGGGQLTYCQHCDTLITELNFKDHGVKCAKKMGS